MHDRFFFLCLCSQLFYVYVLTLGIQRHQIYRTPTEFIVQLKAFHPAQGFSSHACLFRAFKRVSLHIDGLNDWLARDFGVKRRRSVGVEFKAAHVAGRCLRGAQSWPSWRSWTTVTRLLSKLMRCNVLVAKQTFKQGIVKVLHPIFYTLETKGKQKMDKI